MTALVIHDYFGGELLRAVVGDISHYWNQLPDGSIVDMTCDQFDVFQPENTEHRTSEYVLSFPETAFRYRRLAERTKVHLKMESAGVLTKE